MRHRTNIAKMKKPLARNQASQAFLYTKAYLQNKTKKTYDCVWANIIFTVTVITSQHMYKTLINRSTSLKEVGVRDGRMEGHQHGGCKVTETSVIEFCYQNEKLLA